MCNERLALMERYRSLVLEHSKRVSDFSAVAMDDPANERQNHHLDMALVELDISRQAAQEARQQLKQHTVEHGCDGFIASVE